MTKPVILTFIGNYLPGYKAGGILRSMVNTVDHLSDDFDFWIVTRDRDLGDKEPYQDIKTDQWQTVGNAKVYYLSPHARSIGSIRSLILKTQHDIIYLNSFFETLTIKVLLIRRLSSSVLKPVVVAPRGEFAWASLRFKYPKKLIFMYFARIIGLYRNLTWHSSSEFEAADIMKEMKINSNLIHNALDLPGKIHGNLSSVSESLINHEAGVLRLVFLSRISPEKNLDLALEILRKVKTRIDFDIYGPDENIKYWENCKEIMSTLPQNIKVKYFGIVNPARVLEILGQYDLFFFPSGGENYGHVISESLMSGTPVLISDKTPWKNLSNLDFGWDISLDRMDAFVEIIEKYALLSTKDKFEKRRLIKSRIGNYLLDPVVLKANKQLFFKQLVV